MAWIGFLKVFAAASLVLAGPALAQVTAVDPNDVGEYEPVAAQPAAEPSQQSPAESQPWESVPAGEEYQPLTPTAAPVDSPVQQQAAPAPAESAEARASAAVSDAVSKDSVLAAAEGVFGRGAEGLAGVIESILRKQGEPTAYITGSEAGGAIAVGVRYGKGVLHHKAEGSREVYWRGPSVGFDLGADASKVFVLVYNLENSEQLFKPYGAAEGNAFVVGGFKASYLRNDKVVLIPIRMGVGARLGVNAGYMRFSRKNHWLPF